MVRVRGKGADPFYRKWAAYFLDVSGFRRPGGKLVFGSLGMADLRAPVPGILEQEIGISWGPWLMRHLRIDRQYYIIPFMPIGWDPSAGFPAMAGNVPFLMKDVVLLAVSVYLLRQDVMRVSLSARRAGDANFRAAAASRASAAATSQEHRLTDAAE
jgi:hypothetical protein